LFQEQPERSKKSPAKIDMTAALKRDAARLSDDANALCEAELDRILDLLMQDPERWDGLS
jgi:hypothetical protein